MKIDPKQIARMITEDPDEYGGLEDADEFEEHFDDEAFPLSPELEDAIKDGDLIGDLHITDESIVPNKAGHVVHSIDGRGLYKFHIPPELNNEEPMGEPLLETIRSLFEDMGEEWNQHGESDWSENFYWALRQAILNKVIRSSFHQLLPGEFVAAHGYRWRGQSRAVPFPDDLDREPFRGRIGGLTDEQWQAASDNIVVHHLLELHINESSVGDDGTVTVDVSFKAPFSQHELRERPPQNG